MPNSDTVSFSGARSSPNPPDESALTGTGRIVPPPGSSPGGRRATAATEPSAPPSSTIAISPVGVSGNVSSAGPLPCA